MDRLAALPLPVPQPGRNVYKVLSPIWFVAATAFAATAVLVAGLGFGIFQPHEKIYSTALGERKTIALADGSYIELNTDTVVHLTADAHSRTASLERGEAYFRIKHDAHRLFVVKVGDRRVTDVGTKFFVRRDGGKLEVAVVEGRARFDMPGI